MAVIQTTRLLQQFRRLFSLRENYDASLADEIVPVIETNFAADPSQFRIRDENIFLWQVTLPAPGAGNVNRVLIAPLNANDLVIIDQLILSQGGAGEIDVGYVSSSRASGALSAGLMDNRAGGPSQTQQPQVPVTAESATGTPAALGFAAPSPFARFQIPASQSFVFPIRAVIWGGVATQPVILKLGILQQTLNISLILTITGWYRFSEPSEQY